MKDVLKLFSVVLLAGTVLCLTGCTEKPKLSIDENTTTFPTEESDPLSSQTPTMPSFSASPTESTVPSLPEVVHVESVHLDATEKTVVVKEEFALTVTVLPENADDQSYKVSISDPAVLSYAEGTFTALKSGIAVITFTTEDGGKTAKCAVTVKDLYPTDSRYDPESKLPIYQPVFEEGVSYVDYPAKNVKHIFTHDLVAFADPTDHFYTECVTVKEFKEILCQLYENDFVLIDIDYLYEYSYVDGVLHAKYKKSIKVPEGKKPIVLSVDNVAYPIDSYSSARVSGLQVVDGELKTFVRERNGVIRYVEEGDVFPILENFVKEHPDFSFSGAKCVVGPSGRWGVFGWDTRIGAVNYEENLAEAKKVAQWFAANGYAFGCHSYYHDNMGKVTPERISEDFAMWEKEVYPIIGRTHIYIYPLGAFPNKNSDQAKALTAKGYAVFCATSVYAAAWDNNFPDVGNVYAERITISGKELYDYAGGSATKAEVFAAHGLFDPKKVYDNDAHIKKIDW